MLSRFTLLLVLSSISFSALAQKKETFDPFEVQPKKRPIPELTKKYSLDRNDPVDPIRNFTLSLFPAYVDLNQYNNQFGAGLQFAYINMNKFAASLDAQYAYLDRMKDEVDIKESNGFDAKPTSAAYYGNLCFNYFFLSRVERTNEVVPIMLGKSAKTKYYAEVPADRCNNFGARAGFSIYNSFVQDDAGRFRFLNYRVDGPADTNSLSIAYSGKSFSTMQQVVTLNAGVSWTVSRDFILVIPQDKIEVKMHRIREIYLDFQYAVGIKLDNMLMSEGQDPETSEYNRYFERNVDKFTEKFPYGVRVGYQIRNLNPVGYSFALEGGVRPGVKVINGIPLFVNVKFGIAISSKM